MNPTKKDLRDMLDAMIEAAEEVVATWESGDLAGAVNLLEETAEWARALLTR